MNDNVGKIDLSSLNQSTRPRRRRRSEIEESEVRVISSSASTNVEEYDEVEAEELFKESPYVKTELPTPAYLREILKSLKNEDGKILCTILHVQLAHHTVAELFISWLHNLMSQINKRVEQSSGISIFNNKDIRDRYVDSFYRLHNSLRVLMGKGEPDNGSLDDLAKLHNTFGIKDDIKTIFTILYENFGISYEDILLQIPKAVDTIKSNLRNRANSDGMEDEWSDSMVSYSFIHTYLGFLPIKHYTKNPKQ